MAEPEDPSKKETLHKIPKAVSLQYDGDGAPRVTAKGSGYMAEAIIKLAEEHNIPMHHDQSLTNVLSTIKLDHEIPENLYVAVAEVIAFAYRINNKKIKRKS